MGRAYGGYAALSFIAAAQFGNPLFGHTQFRSDVYAIHDFLTTQGDPCEVLLHMQLTKCLQCIIRELFSLRNVK